jgi:uncharacterized protein YecT (DUF1311 family)
MNHHVLFFLCRARRLWALACAVALVAMATVVLAAQDQGAGNAQDAQAAPAAFVNTIPPEQLKFLSDFEGKTTRELRKDKRFRKLVNQITPRTTYHYGRDMSLGEALDTLMDGTPLPVDVRDGRYVMAGTKSGPILSGKAFVWFDMETGIGLGGVYFHPTNGEPTPTLAIFSRQLKANTLGMSQLPAAFAQDVAQWGLIANARWVTVRYFIPDDGKKYVLLHDVDYCEHRETAPAQANCQELNAEAADDDMNGAYFMQETHNQANATAWMLEPDQVSWIAFRDRSCGVGAVALPCRIRVTRQRTRVILGRR